MSTKKLYETPKIVYINDIGVIRFEDFIKAVKDIEKVYCHRQDKIRHFEKLVYDIVKQVKE